MVLPESLTFKIGIEVLKIIPTVIIAGIVAYIAYQQWRINCNRLKIEMFEKRYEVYKYLHEFLTSTYKSCVIDLEETYELSAMLNYSHLLFGDDVTSYLHKFTGFAELMIIEDVAEREKKTREWCLEISGSIGPIFRPYMDLRKL
jgi:hypothetical protein